MPQAAPLVRKPPESPEFKTSDIALVSWMRYNRVEPLQIMWSDQLRVCYWIFDNDARVKALVFQFENGQARPEVRAFNSIFGNTKKEMYASKPAQ